LAAYANAKGGEEGAKTKAATAAATDIIKAVETTSAKFESAPELEAVAEGLKKEGVEPGQISARLADDFPLTRRTIARYLPEKYKDLEHVKNIGRQASSEVSKVIETTSAKFESAPELSTRGPSQPWTS
jgi:hypothetical protein